MKKSRKVKAFNARRKPKPDIALDESGSDVDQDSFFHDEIDDLNEEKDNELSTDDELIQHREKSSDEEEVLPITDDEEDDDEDDDVGKDESDEEDEHDLPNRDAWGKKKSAYYSADFVDEDRGRTYREEDAEAAKAEADEAYAIQKSVYSNIVADNLGANLFLEGSGESSDDEDKVDLMSATKEEKLRYLATETQILEVCKQFKLSIEDLKKFSKIIHVLETKKIKSEFEKYVRIKNSLLSLYCLNLSLYMMFASSGKNPKYHPVTERISTCKQLLDDLKAADNAAIPAINNLMTIENYDEEVEFSTSLEKDEDELKETPISSEFEIPSAVAVKEKRKRKSKVQHLETEAEREIMSLIGEVRNELKKRKLEEIDEEDQEAGNERELPTGQDESTDDKRIINYQIAKNKGLIPHRKKEYRNPRVRHRMKYRKAQIRRKGQVRGVYKEIKRYEGEPTGINTNVVKSIKYK